MMGEPLGPPEKIDFHCHIASTDFFPPSFLEGIVQNIGVALEAGGVRANKRKIRDLYLAKLQDPLCDQLVREMDEAAIATAVLLLADFTFALRDSKLTIAEMVERHRLVRERHPGRFRAFAGVDPRWGSDGLDLFEKAVNGYGFDGFKVYPPCGFGASDKRLYPYYEICAANAIPALVHIGATSPSLGFEYCSPMDLDRAARDFPTVNFVLAHGSVHYPDESAMMCSHRPNVYLDVSGFEMAGLSRLKALFGRRINHKILFGTDWPLFRLQATQAEWLRRLLASAEAFPADMSQMDRNRFWFGNARRLLGTRVPFGRSSIVGERAADLHG